MLFSVSILSFLPPALRADDQTSASSGSSLRLVSSESGDPGADLLVRQAPPSNPAEVTKCAAPLPLFSHTKWEGPAAIVPREPDLHWKGAFRPVRQPTAAVDADVVQTSGEMPLGTVQSASLPNPSPPRRIDSPDSPAQPQAAEPQPPLRIPPVSETSPAPLPTLEEQLAEHPRPTERCDSPRSLKSIRMINADISVRREDMTGSKRLPPECSLGDTPFRPRHWNAINFAWTAASTCHNPMYFEDDQMERCGNSLRPALQTTVSAVRFFGTVPLLPYYMGVYPTNECIYDLGQYRPGNCAPYYLDPFPLSVRGALYEGTFLGLLPVL